MDETSTFGSLTTKSKSWGDNIEKTLQQGQKQLEKSLSDYSQSVKNDLESASKAWRLSVKKLLLSITLSVVLATAISAGILYWTTHQLRQWMTDPEIQRLKAANKSLSESVEFWESKFWTPPNNETEIYFVLPPEVKTISSQGNEYLRLEISKQAKDGEIQTLKLVPLR